MRILVTGATGFLGKHVVAEAVRQGHDVRAVVRPASNSTPPWWSEHASVEIVRGELRNASSIPSMLDGIEQVIHLAAVKAGSFYEQFAGTVIGTENLIDAMVGAGQRRMVLCSTFSVYEYLGRWSWAKLDEGSPLEGQPEHRDEYCQTKLIQEQLVRDAAREHEWQCVVLRPGVIFGPDNLWTARLGMQISERWNVRIGALARLPLTYVENCASAFVRAAEYSGKEPVVTVNVVDDECPGQASYLRAVIRARKESTRTFPLPWWAMRVLARSAWLTNSILFRGQCKLPGLLRPPALHARFKPLRYENRHIREVLGWQPEFDWREGIRRTLNGRADEVASQTGPSRSHNEVLNHEGLAADLAGAAD